MLKFLKNIIDILFHASAYKHVELLRKIKSKELKIRLPIQYKSLY